jgi:hypothetical protein
VPTSTSTESLLLAAQRRIEAATEAHIVVCGGTGVVVRCLPGRLLTDLAGLCEGFFSVAPGDLAPVRIYACEDERWRAEAARWWRAAKSGGPVTDALPRSLGRVQIARCSDDDGGPSAYALVDPSAALVLLLLPPRRPEASASLFVRVVRAAILVQLRDAGWAYLHAACLRRGETGLALTGPKFAGKTTLALHLLSRPGWRLVANDKLAVRPGPEGIDALGFPIRMGIRAGSLVSMPEPTATTLRAAAGKEAGSERIHVPPQVVASCFGTAVAPDAPLSLVVEPRHDPAATQPRMVELDRREALALLRSQYLADLGAIAENQRFVEALHPRRQALPDPAFIAGRIIERVRVFRLHHDHRANQQTVALLEAALRPPSRLSSAVGAR